jgi:hypothetical protein
VGAGAGEIASVGIATPVAGAIGAHGVTVAGMGITNLVKDFQKVNSKGADNGGGRGSNNLKPDQNAQGDHSTFQRDDNGDIYKYQEWNQNDRNPSGYDAGKRFDGGTPDGKPGAEHYNKKTGEFVPTPHVQEGKTVRPANSNELPDNSRFKKPN